MMSMQQRQMRGFTLLEIIIVAFILALIAGAVVVNVTAPQRDSDVQTATVVFKEKLEHARQMALIRNWVIGVDVQERHYAFYRWQDNQWQEMVEPPLHRVDFEQLTLELQPGNFALLDNIIDGDRSAVFRPERERNGNRDEDEMVVPRLLVFESSDFVPFQLAIRDPFTGDFFGLDGRDGLHLTLVEDALR
ncbi:pilus assembly FimT family protein [Aliidiomarina maris]|uniref:Type II secretion system protein GspH n=1 Tax=Aliidiomarina maris TaxID=531312 RepID=A0A327X2A9_9GAMM|nr:type II secretion system protein [Aliidiomarina maris]RAK00681.1 type II secretion system protein H (GspH) [Aliidiomarina maris]RUO27314.1 type II secretion system protein GspH [Aliidiomarina maris]